MTDDPEITDPRDPYKRDIVAELDRWLAGLPSGAYWPLICRARDEIVALRRYKHENHEALEVIQKAAELINTQEVGAVSEAKLLIRDAALEEAARLCEGGYTTGSTASTLKTVAKAIRALKETL